MQAVLSSSQILGSALAVRPTGLTAQRPARVQSQRVCASKEPLYVGYNPKKTVFPAEACEELGGEFCEVEGVGPEVKPVAKEAPKGEAFNPFANIFAGKEREYVNYDESKTVFPAEACDQLGGEFCAPEYQEGVFQEKK